VVSTDQRDLEVGGRYQLQGNAGGVVERCEEPESFAVTWEMGPMVSWLEVTLSPADDGTVLELAHEAHVDPELWGQFGPGAVGLGWDGALMGLGLYLESGAAVDPSEAAAFPTSPDGVAFFGRAAAEWADAAIADGDEPDAAKQAAVRAEAFYTTPPEDAEAG
jgi:Activator of Hsp90 ATPase homolog 1-like protein